jgi:hypothetical protein
LLGDLDLVSLFSVDVFEVGDSCGSSNTVEVVLQFYFKIAELVLEHVVGLN